tara:strand:+ start:2733 stop:3236 length:504 start_codon:yes stop_codon:yes gene_type:complete
MLRNVIRIGLLIFMFSYLVSCGFKPMYKFSESNVDLNSYSINIVNESDISRQIKEEIKKSFPSGSKAEKDFVIDMKILENLDPLITNTDGTISKYGIEIIIYFKVKTRNTNELLINDVVRGFAQYTVETSEIESDDKKKRMTRTATSGAVQMIISKIQSETLIKNDN